MSGESEKSVLSYGAQLLAKIFKATPQDNYTKNGLPKGEPIISDEMVEQLQTRAMKI